MATRHFVFPPA